MHSDVALELSPSCRPQYRTTEINNRRYLGNKYRLLPFITHVVNSECKGIETFADIFAGTGAVSSAFRDKVVITNDLMYSNYICNHAWFGCEAFDRGKIIEIEHVNARYILLSYNNMARKGNDRSNAKISDDDIMRILERKGTVKVFAEDYKSFTTGKSDIIGNQERLFLCNCFKEI